MSEVKAVARYLLPGPTFKGISPSFGQVRSYDEYSEEHVKETKGYWTEGEKLYREADYNALAAQRDEGLAREAELRSALEGMLEYFPVGHSDGEQFSVEAAKAALASPGCADGEKGAND